MDDGNEQVKSTGYTPSTKPGNENASAPVEFTDVSRASPVLINVPMKDASMNTSKTVTPVELTGKILMAIAVILGDFKALRALSSTSWQAINNGKIYWCVDLTGHAFTVENGKILVDEQPLDLLLENLMVK